MTDTNFLFRQTVIASPWLQDVNNTVYRPLASVAALRLKGAIGTPAPVSQWWHVLGYYTPGDGGGGFYYPVFTDTTSADNGGTIIVGADGTRWYLYLPDGQPTLKQFGAIGNGVANDTAAVQAACNTGSIVKATAGTYLLNSTITLKDNGGILSVNGQAAIFQRNFVGGTPLFKYPNGSFITLRDFAVTTTAGLTAIAGDSGIELGLVATWSGRCDIANLFISGQFDGLKWQGGNIDTMSNILCQQNLGSGFYGITPLQILDSCVSQGNTGNGFFIFETGNGAGQPQFRNCTSFNNGGVGYLFNNQASAFGANLWMDGCVSSVDAGGGIVMNSVFNQAWISNTLVEYGGYTEPGPTVLNHTAPGISMTGPGQDSIFLSNVFVNSCAGNGAVFEHITGLNAVNLSLWNNGQGVSGSANQIGLLLSADTDAVFTGLSADVGANQTTDISVGGSNTNTRFVGSSFRTYFTDGTAKSQFVGRSQATSISPSVSAAATITIPDFSDTIQVGGATAISTISGSLLTDRRITLIFQAAGCTVVNTGNVLISTTYTSTVGSTLNLVYDGANWRQG